PDARARPIWRKHNDSAIPGVGHGRPLQAKSGTGQRKLIACLVSTRTTGRRDSKYSYSAFVRRTRRELEHCSKRRFARKPSLKRTTQLFTRAVLPGTSTRSVIRFAMRLVNLWNSWARLSM